MNSYAMFQMEGVTHDGLPFNQPLPNPHPSIGRKPRPALLYIPPVEVPLPSPSPLWHMPKQPQPSNVDRRRRRLWQDDPPVPAASQPVVPLSEPGALADSIRAAVAPAKAARRPDETMVTIPLREIPNNSSAACVDYSSARGCSEERDDSHVIDLAAELRAYREKFQQLQADKEKQRLQQEQEEQREREEAQKQRQQQEEEQREREEAQKRRQQLVLESHKTWSSPTSTSSSSSTRKYRQSWLCAVDTTKLWNGLVDVVCGVPEVSGPPAWAPPATSTIASSADAMSSSELLTETMRRSESLEEILSLRDVIVRQLEKRDATGINSPRSVFSPNLSIASSGVSPSSMFLE